MNILKVNLKEKSYHIYIESGLLDNISEEIKKIHENGKIAVITDKNVERLYGEKLLNSLKDDFEVKIISLEPGEKSKSMDVAQNVYDELLDFEITRGDLVIAFGGGVVGDLAGFISSTLFRGIPFVQIPTSLLAQIDSSIGGKVAVNSPKGKNLIGSFYHPEAVYIDPYVLKTLDKRFLYDGIAEVIKYGCIKDENLFSDLLEYSSDEEILENIEKVIYKCCKIKKDIVENDEKDMGVRMTLNFGHTLGHALEKYFDYEIYTHGEAVAVGMYSITKNSEEMGLTQRGTVDRLKQILKKYKLPYKLPYVNRLEVIENINLDKKNKGNKINLILLNKIGDSFIKNIDRKDINMNILNGI